MERLSIGNGKKACQTMYARHVAPKDILPTDMEVRGL